MNSLWWIPLTVVLLSPIGVPFILSRKWSLLLVSRARFFSVAAAFLLMLIISSFLLVDKLVDQGVEYFYLQGHSCDQWALCRAFDFVFVASGLLSLVIYLFVMALWLHGIKKRQPKWLGFRPKTGVPNAPVSQ